MVKRKQIFKKTVAVASVLAVVSPIAATAAALDTTTYKSEQTYQGFATNYTFIDTFDSFYASEKFGYIPIYGYGDMAEGTKGEPVTGGLGKAEDDNYYKLTIGDEASVNREMTYGGKKCFDFSDTKKDMYFTIEFYNPSETKGQVEFRPSFGRFDSCNYFNADGTITSGATASDILGKYELDKWNTVTLRISNGNGSTDKYTKEMYLNGEFVYRLPFASNNEMTRGYANIRFTSATANTQVYFDNVGIGLVADDKTTGSYVEEPVFDKNGKFTVEGKTISYKIGATIDDLIESITNISDFGDGENIALFNADDTDITSSVENIKDIASVQFKNGDYTRTYTLQKVISPDDKTWMNVDFDDDNTEVLSSVADEEIRNGLLTAIQNNISVGSATPNNQLAAGNEEGAFGAEIVAGAPGRAADDKSLRLELPKRNSGTNCQLNFEWRDAYKVINTDTSDFVVEFSVMIPKASSGAKIQPIMFYNGTAAGVKDENSIRRWGISNYAINNNAIVIGEKQANGTISDRWTKVAYHFTKFATVTDGAIVKNSGECDIYVDGVKYATLNHSMPNISAFQFKLEAQDLPKDYTGDTQYSTIYIDDIKLYTFKDEIPYFLDSALSAPVYNSPSGYDFDDTSKNIFTDSFANMTVSSAANLIGAQTILNSNLTAKAADANVAFTDIATFKSADGNIIYYYGFKEKTVSVDSTDIVKNDTAYTYTATLTNNTTSPVSGHVYLAGYDADGVMVGVEAQSFSDVAAKGGIADLNVTAEFENAAKVRVYIWNNNQKPITDVIKNITVQEK